MGDFKMYVIKRVDQDIYVTRKANAYCLAYDDDIEQAKKFKTLEDADKYLNGWIKEKFKIIKM